VERLSVGFNTYAEAIRNLSGSINLSATTVVQSDVLSGKKFRNKNGEIEEGTIPYIPNIIISGAGTAAVNGNYIFISGDAQSKDRLWQHSTNKNYLFWEAVNPYYPDIRCFNLSESDDLNMYFWGDYNIDYDIEDLVPTNCTAIQGIGPCPSCLVYPKVNQKTGELNIQSRIYSKPNYIY
jgi:hypothetical protein